MSRDAQQTREPVAIIGIGCRFPGGATTPEAFWHVLSNGVDAVTEVPPDRWDIRTYYDPDRSKQGKAVTRWGAFLNQIDQFDAQFFGISPREAAYLDPQQRLLLETCWEALEDGAQAPDTLTGSQVGVFIGCFTLDYKVLQFTESNRHLMSGHTATGAMMTLVANRISHAFDFRGPSVAIDTACSSSLVAVHLACQSLRDGECTIALAGGVNVMLKPEYTIAESQAGMLSPDGRCKVFDSNANGYVRGEGAGVVVLKPLSQALADGDPIYAVVRGTAINQDGHTPGITVPSGEAQQALMRECYRRAGVSPGQIQYVEAHGTGTPVGDPIEANALGTVLSTDRPEGNDCYVGSLKTNIGHTEAAAGVAGLIKAALCLKHRQIPPHLHLKEPNPQISFAQLRLRVPTTLTQWPDTEGPALAAVNSFGFGGTNAHAVLEEAPRVSPVTLPAPAPARALVLPPVRPRAGSPCGFSQGLPGFPGDRWCRLSPRYVLHGQSAAGSPYPPSRHGGSLQRRGSRAPRCFPGLRGSPGHDRREPGSGRGRPAPHRFCLHGHGSAMVGHGATAPGRGAGLCGGGAPGRPVAYTVHGLVSAGSHAGRRSGLPHGGN